MWMPVKTNDIVIYQGVEHVVKNVQITPDGPLLDIRPIRTESQIVHASEIKLLDTDEADFRGKSIGLDKIDNTRVTLPTNVTPREARVVLDQLARTKQEGGRQCANRTSTYRRTNG